MRLVFLDFGIIIERKKMSNGNCQPEEPEINFDSRVEVRQYVSKLEQQIKKLKDKLHHYEVPVHRCKKCKAQIIPRCKCGVKELEVLLYGVLSADGICSNSFLNHIQKTLKGKK